MKIIFFLLFISSFVVSLFSEDFYSIDTVPSASTTFTVSEGWNLISLPGYTKQSSDQLFANNDKIDLLWTYDLANGVDGWTKYTSLSSSTMLDPSRGYWLLVKEGKEYSFNISVQNYSGVEIGQPMDFEIELEDTNGGYQEITEKTIKIFDDKARFETYFSKANIVTTTPAPDFEIDFSKSIAILIMEGFRGNIDRAINVTNILEFNDYIEVHYNKVIYTGYILPATAGAFSLISLPETDKSIRFIESTIFKHQGPSSLSSISSSSAQSQTSSLSPDCERHYDICKVYPEDKTVPIELLYQYQTSNVRLYEPSRIFYDKESAIKYYDYFKSAEPQLKDTALIIIEEFDFEKNSLVWLMDGTHAESERLTCIQAVETMESFEVHYAIVLTYYMYDQEVGCAFASNYYRSTKLFLYAIPKIGDTVKSVNFYDHSDKWEEFYK